MNKFFKACLAVFVSLAVMIFFAPTVSDLIGLDDTGIAIAKKGGNHGGKGKGSGKGKGHGYDNGPGHGPGKGKGKGHHKGGDNGCPGYPSPEPTPDPTPEPDVEIDMNDNDPNMFWRKTVDGWVNCDTDWKRATYKECEGLPYQAY